MVVALCVLMLVAPGALAQPSTPSSSGSYATSVPITVPPYYGLEPNVRLDYDSQRGAQARDAALGESSDRGIPDQHAPPMK